MFYVWKHGRFKPLEAEGRSGRSETKHHTTPPGPRGNQLIKTGRPALIINTVCSGGQGRDVWYRVVLRVGRSGGGAGLGMAEVETRGLVGLFRR